ncbi:MAG: hypothetical protein GY894_07900 [Planctomycetes bacterium]|nr:hypothetical protein [Planctomycetota bacterium]
MPQPAVDRRLTPLLNQPPSSRPSSSARNLPEDADLWRLMKIWPTLPNPIRAGIMTMVTASGDGHVGEAELQPFCSVQGSYAAAGT